MKFFCTKTAQSVYAQCTKHPGFTHWQGEPVTFLVVERHFSVSNTIAAQQSTLFKTRPLAPGFMRFHRVKWKSVKKM
jgi:hypothetical protein